MMEGTNSMLLDTDALNKVANDKKPVFILQWLVYLDKALVTATPSFIKEHQKALVDQLVHQIQQTPGPPTRKLLARCLATMFNVGDTFLLFDAVNKCNDILKNRDDSPSFLPVRLGAISCIGVMYEKLGRLMGRSHEETVALLLKSLKSVESQSRCEIYLTLERIVAGMGSAASSMHRDLFKAIRHGLTDRVMPVRCSAAKCLEGLIAHAPFLYTSDLESVFSLCFRSFEGSNYDVRCSVSQVLATLVHATQSRNHYPPTSGGSKPLRVVSLDEVLSLMSTGFLRGGIGFLKGHTEIIKGSSTVSRETRSGVTHAYAAMIQKMGTIWFERNMSPVMTHLLELLVNPRCLGSHVESVYSRKCISFIFNCITERKLCEKTQGQVIKGLVHIVNRNIIHVNPVGAEPNQVTTTGSTENQHLLICAMDQLGGLILSLGTSANCLLNDPSIGLFDCIYSCLTHPCPATRLSAAWTLRCVAVASPSQLPPLIDRTLHLLEKSIGHIECISGYSATLASLLGSTTQTPLGIPHNKGKLVFNVAEEMLRTSIQNSRLSLQRTQSGWLMIGAVITLGSSVVKGLLARLLLLWKNSFPRSSKELESEKSRGDAFTWQVTLENRCGALSAMTSLLTNCSRLVTEEVMNRMLIPVEAAVTMLMNLTTSLKNYGPSVKASLVTTRLRLFELLLLIPASKYEPTFTSLLRLLVAEFTLNESPANTTTSLLRTMCYVEDDIIIGSWIHRTDHKMIEDQIQPNSIGSGALEHDPTCVYKIPESGNEGPFPLGVAVIDKSCLLFAHIFPFVANKHRIQMLTHFQECIRHSKSTRQEAVQMNILTSLLGSLKNMGDLKSTIGSDDVKGLFLGIIMNMLCHANPVIRSACGQAIGRLGQVVGEGKFVSEVVQSILEKLKAARDALSRTGYSLALGSLHRHVGSLGSNQQLNTSFSILLALSHDVASPIVQVWALNSMALIADSGGPTFRSYVDASLTQSIRLLMSVPESNCDVHQCIGKLLSSVIVAIGPELQSDNESIRNTRGTLILCCTVMQNHRDPLVQTQGILCLQQLHIFSPKHLDLEWVIPRLCISVSSNFLFLRRASISCLYQMTQIEAERVTQLGSLWAKQRDISESNMREILQPEHGFAGLLFCVLDTETDHRISQDVKKIVMNLVQSFASGHLNEWISLCKEVLTAAETNSTLSSPDKDGEGDDGDGDMNDVGVLHFKAKEDTDTAGPPKWKTRVFATQVLYKMIVCCDSPGDRDMHFDLSRVREQANGEPYLVHHLSDLIRMSFMAATSDSDLLRLEGLKALGLIIEKFSKVPEPEFPDHVILEQFQAQVGAALRPAFSPDTPSHVTATACEVCSAWIGSGVARDLNDLRRVHQLLVSSLEKLRKGSSSRQYNESAATLEKLSILKAWAEVYVVAMKEEEENRLRKHRKMENRRDSDDDEDLDVEDFGPQESLLKLVTPELDDLINHWLCSLKDHALLTLPGEFASQLPREGGSFYASDTIEVARPIYRNSWPPILHAAALWLCSTDFNHKPDQTEEDKTKVFHLLFGIAMESLCNPKSSEATGNILVCLNSLKTLFSHSLPRTIVARNREVSIELASVIHRLLLTRESHSCQIVILEIAEFLVLTESEKIEEEKRVWKKSQTPANQVTDEEAPPAFPPCTIGEGGETGDLQPGDSIVFSLLEMCLSVLVRQVPQLSPSLTPNPNDQPSPNGAIPVANPVEPSSRRVSTPLSGPSIQLICSSIKILSSLPDLCSPPGSLSLLPSILYLLTGIMKETTFGASTGRYQFELVQTLIHSYGRICSSPLARNPKSFHLWNQLLQSTLSMVLDVCKSCDDQPKPDDTITVQIVSVFISKAPPRVVRAPNLRFPCINLLTQSLQSEVIEVQITCLKSLKDIFSVKDQTVSVPYIQALGPRVFELLTQMSNRVNLDSLSLISKGQYDVILESLGVSELLLNLTDASKRIELLSLLIPILLSFLCDSLDQDRGRPYRSTLHNHVLGKLLVIGPQFPGEFKQIITQVPLFKSKLENAIRHQQSFNALQSRQARSSTLMAHQRPEAPVIQLKTDFSNYH